MIAFVQGLVSEIEEENVVIENGGFGINVRISASTAARLPRIGETVRLYTYTAVREDAFWLYGFLSKAELALFKRCISVSGIGPKGGLCLLSAMDADTLRYAILKEDVKTIAKAPGIGKRTAERLVLELKDKLSWSDDSIDREISGASTAQAALQEDLAHPACKEALEALEALGYGAAESRKALLSIADKEAMDAGRLLKEALKKLF